MFLTDDAMSLIYSRRFWFFFYRLFQFTSRIVWSSSQDNSSKWKALEESLNTTRKALQLLRFIDLMYSARASIHLEDKTHRITITMSRIATSLFYLTDNIVYAARIGLIDVDRNKWFKLSYRLWLYALIMNLLRDAYEIQRQLEKLERRRRRTRDDLLQDMIDICSEKPGIAVDTVKNLCDLMLPLSSLNHLPSPLSARMIGILGAVSSLCSLLQLTQPSFRLTPS